jgi:hypothetical protein
MMSPEWLMISPRLLCNLYLHSVADKLPDGGSDLFDLIKFDLIKNLVYVRNMYVIYMAECFKGDEAKCLIKTSSN